MKPKCLKKHHCILINITSNNDIVTVSKHLSFTLVFCLDNTFLGANLKTMGLWKNFWKFQINQCLSSISFTKELLNPGMNSFMIQTRRLSPLALKSVQISCLAANLYSPTTYTKKKQEHHERNIQLSIEALNRESLN